jgi:NADH dehydrogenase
MLATMIRRLPSGPVLGSGRHQLQPVAVEQVAEGFARALGTFEAVKQVYEVGGPDRVAMLELLDRIGETLGHRRILKFHVPLGLVRPMARLLHPLPFFPVTPDQLLMLEGPNTCDPTPFFSTFGLTPVRLTEGLRAMLA